MPCLQPYGAYGGQAAIAANDVVNNKTASSFFMVYSLVVKKGYRQAYHWLQVLL